MRLAPTAAYPVKLPSWPSTMLMPTAVTNPVITAVGTNRSSEPAPSSPAATMTRPVRTLSVNSALSGSAREARSTSETTRAIAPVACTARKALLVNSAAPARPKR